VQVIVIFVSKLVFKRYYARNSQVFEAFEKAFFIPIFESVDDFYGHGFDMDFMFEITFMLPPRFLANVTKCLTGRIDFNKEFMSKLGQFHKSSPIFKVKDLDVLLKTLPVRP
jgi:hypothetical protein